jgi:hypothetical protein
MTDPIAWWKLDETTGTRYDTLANHYDMAESNGPVDYGSGKYGNSAKLRDTTLLGYIPTLITNDMMTFGADFAISFWFKFERIANYYGVSFSVNFLQKVSFYIQESTSDRDYARVEVDYYRPLLHSEYTGYDYIKDLWHHVCMTYRSGVGYSVYIDGEIVISSSDAISSTPYRKFSIRSSTVGNPDPGYGYVDDTRIWDTYLTEDEILRIYQPLNFSMTANKGTLTITGQSAGLNMGRRLQADAGTVTLSGMPVSLRHHQNTMPAFWRGGYFGIDEPRRMKMFRFGRIVTDQTGFRISNNLVDHIQSTFRNPERIDYRSINNSKIATNRKAKLNQYSIQFPENDADANVLELSDFSIPLTER